MSQCQGTLLLKGRRDSPAGRCMSIPIPSAPPEPPPVIFCSWPSPWSLMTDISPVSKEACDPACEDVDKPSRSVSWAGQREGGKIVPQILCPPHPSEKAHFPQQFVCVMAGSPLSFLTGWQQILLTQKGGRGPLWLCLLLSSQGQKFWGHLAKATSGCSA